MLDRYLTTGEAAERLGLSRSTVQYLCRKGKLRSYKIGYRLVRIPESAIIELERSAGQ